MVAPRSLLIVLLTLGACSKDDLHRSLPRDAAGPEHPVAMPGEPCHMALWPSATKPEQRAVEFRGSEVVIIFDNSETSGIAYGNGTRSSAMVDTINRLVDDYQTRVAFGLMTFPDASNCGSLPACCLGELSVDLGLHQGPAIRAALAHRPAPQGGSPMAQALQKAGHLLRATSQDSSKLILLASDGNPGCDATYADASTISPACQEAVQIVQGLAQGQPAIRTLVLAPGMDFSAQGAECLGHLRQAADQGRDGAIVADDLDHALKGSFVSAPSLEPDCAIQLFPIPANDARITVYVDGRAIPKHDDDGWWIKEPPDGDAGGGIPTLGLSRGYCERLRQLRYDKVEVEYDCIITSAH